jgi:hypothetical protein
MAAMGTISSEMRAGDYFCFAMTKLDTAVLFRDVSDKKLELAADYDKAIIMRHREDQLKFKFYDFMRDLCLVEDINSSGLLPRDLLDAAMSKASEAYARARVAKKTKMEETAVAKA